MVGAGVLPYVRGKNEIFLIFQVAQGGRKQGYFIIINIMI